jgi:hypothetical protein
MDEPRNSLGSSGQAVSRKSETHDSEPKMMIIIVWNTQGFHLVDALAKGQKFNANYTEIDTLTKNSEIEWWSWPELFSLETGHLFIENIGIVGSETIAEINIRKIARHDLVLQLKILRIDFSFLELRESFCDNSLVESLRLLASSRPVSFPD